MSDSKKDPAAKSNSLKSPALEGDKTGWGGSKNSGVKNSGKNMQSSGYDTAGEEANGHKQS